MYAITRYACSPLNSQFRPKSCRGNATENIDMIQREKYKCKEKVTILLFVCSGTYSLSITDHDPQKGQSVKHYRIRQLDDGGYYITTRSQFREIADLIEHYKGKNHIVTSSHRLRPFRPLQRPAGVFSVT